ncbi:putative GTPase activating protein for Arf family protein [Theileria parva strain Muguga]|uniref:putative GTPase activating protein for Arf family protein n=1 Tax=Theileria parva strain Muguga TaxID=333668 RepID=UPI001C61F546|nr:putative GTPase activating protein for Arf family protein [Theileria parva strain Muguga]EAN33380.2 putative GTPase activating protein for Arf family protein [Theileria parva strain Muguga]
MASTDFISKVCSIDGNNFCADCGSRAPRWASVNLGVLLCINCSGIHRTLGVHLSQVKSLTLDNLKPDWIKSLLSIGNNVANAYYLYKLPPEVSRYYASASPSDMEIWIRNKYEKKLYAMDGLDEPFILLSKGYNPRESVLNRTLHNQPVPQYKHSPKQPVADLLSIDETFGTRSNYEQIKSNLNDGLNPSYVDDFNPFSIDNTQRTNDIFWPNDNQTRSYKDEPRETLGVPDIPEPEDSDKIRDAKIDAAKNSIAKLFQNPTQIGFKNSSYNSIVSHSLSPTQYNIKNRIVYLETDWTLTALT